MVGTCIYSKRYAAEYIDTGEKHPAITVFRKQEALYSEEEFIEIAVELSEKCRIGVDIFDREDRLRVDFILHTELVSEEYSYLWDMLMNHSNLFGLVVRSTAPQTVLVSFVLIKSKYLEAQ